MFSSSKTEEEKTLKKGVAKVSPQYEKKIRAQY